MSIPKSVPLRVAILPVVVWLVFSAFKSTECTYQLRELVGWTIVDAKTINGEFEGCDFDRVVRFMDGTSLVCSAFGYTYAYMPDAILFARSVQYEGSDVTLVKMMVGDQVYDMSIR